MHSRHGAGLLRVPDFSLYTIIFLKTGIPGVLLMLHLWMFTRQQHTNTAFHHGKARKRLSTNCTFRNQIHFHNWKAILKRKKCGWWCWLSGMSLHKRHKETKPSALILFSQDPTCSQSVLPSILVQTRVMWFQPDQRESPDFLSNLIGSVLYMWPIRSQIRMQIQSTRWVAVRQLVLVLEGWRQSFRFEDIIGRGSTYRECMKPLIWRRPFWSTQATPGIAWLTVVFQTPFAFLRPTLFSSFVKRTLDWGFGHQALFLLVD